ncbi:selenophosphate synthase [[Leptolyngbya] sp. PCC 7376]|uniref:selenide, water dikinase SelD n=1 Tax=[Leptolyngbya] sp. PCC 7376 TaxID=111781 RepID=UPI00029F2B67|nr:selenide, water dikinase SelD [[Leptolyngbya] sp. PCC 7376]AFY37112.1 selenophosphate synthase [[Leptolyngbya] sp. PCC 7376]
MTDLVLVGGGHSHAIALRMWAMNPLPDVHLTLISNVTYTPYSGMLPGYVAGFYDYEETHIDLRRLAYFAKADFLRDEVVGLDLEKKQVICRDRPPVRFDHLSLDIGSTPSMGKISGAKEYAIPAKPVPEFLSAWQVILDNASKHPTQKQEIIIVGGGAGGTELAFNIHHALTQKLASPDLLSLQLVHRGPELVNGNGNPWVSQLTEKLLRERGVNIHLNQNVAQVSKNGLQCQSGLKLTGQVIWVTQASAPAWIKQSGIQADTHGFVVIDETLRSPSHPFVFATGDIASMQDHPRPKAGVFAVRQGKPLFQNWQRTFTGDDLIHYKPQKRYLALIGTGDKQAIATRGKLGWRAKWLWDWKDKIDRKFMDQFTDLPEMKPMMTMAEPKPKMYCAGCGAKVGKDILSAALADLEISETDGVIVGLDQPDDAAVIQVPNDKLLVQTVDYFPSLINDPYLLGQIVTQHCLSDLYTMGAMPHSVLVLASIPHGKARVQQGLLSQMLAGVTKVLREENIALIGGHTNESDKLGLGLTCNGFIERDDIWRKGKVKAGQALILTKPLGTGTLFAAEMQQAAKGKWINGAIASMVQSNRKAAEILRNHSATACTDITGFGLAGHLLEMLQTSGLSAELYLDQLPILDGALESIAQDFTSSLAPQNHTAEQFIHSEIKSRAKPKYELIFDPQTSGGLLASIDEEQRENCIKALRQNHYLASAQIGKIFTAEYPSIIRISNLGEINS